MRYYVHNSSYFDSHPYNRPKIARAVKVGGGSNVRTSYAYGWSNQPKVVTFDATQRTLPTIRKSVERATGASFIIIHTKDW